MYLFRGRFFGCVTFYRDPFHEPFSSCTSSVWDEDCTSTCIIMVQYCGLVWVQGIWGHGWDTVNPLGPKSVAYLSLHPHLDAVWYLFPRHSPLCLAREERHGPRSQVSSLSSIPHCFPEAQC